eukprot:CAMPEP_0197833432 /NCGR_PEP_ID=MMETSP1437-20131217/19023_1 /TAXON_ID=49252 ORGANISM="Eucampia antarctica, Strain CCMP1452" /NCGR_SAMPLE_ID=MMETSP1437 /ASSEMBLY_ACC=CAM_ASM_001096 /LENGTH=204 /DNA_ID=CAMNT_0043437497 /DNA_START=77 /DNA_END=691 /DNA_ORIENTATION=-
MIAYRSDAFSPSSFGTRRDTMTCMAKGRRSSLRKTIQGKSSEGGGGINQLGGPQSGAAKKTNWVPVSGISSMNDLPQEENSVKVVDTMAKVLTNIATNPTGAVSVVNFAGNTYCFSSSCPSCKFPMIKATVLPPNEETEDKNPRVTCDFCKATYNIKTGAVLKESSPTGLVGGIVKGLFSAKEKEPLPTYDLGEKNGQVLINLP